MKVEIKAKRFWECPKCGDEHWIEHLLDGTTVSPSFSWACDCGATWRFPMPAPDATSVELSASERERREPVLVTLEMPPQEKPVRITFRGFRYYQDGESSVESADDSLRYLYEEHSCPVNWLHNLKEVFAGEEADPHGLFKFIKAEPWKDDEP